jgi:hypothetical protein
MPVLDKEALSKVPGMQAIVREELARRAEAARVANPPTPTAAAAAADLGTLADERDKKDEKGPKDKPDKAKPSVAGMEFSTLRAIGGAMAGESTFSMSEDENLKVQKEIRDILSRLAEQNAPSIDFTKQIAGKIGSILGIK